MGGNGKLRNWKISLYLSSPSKSNEDLPDHHQQPPTPQPPKEFFCSICNSIISNPVVVASGQTFDFLCVQVCKELNFTPTLSDGATPDFSAVIPNLAFKSAIVGRCKDNRVVESQPLDYVSIKWIVRGFMGCEREVVVDEETVGIRPSERELIDAVAEKPDLNISHAVTVTP